MSQRGVIFHQLDDGGREWAMNGFVPPLVMNLNVDTLQWCTQPLPSEYPDKVRTYTMTNDHYLLKTCWLGPYVKMSHWLDQDSKPMVYGPIATRMESAGGMLKNLFGYFNTHDVLYAADFDPNLSTDLTLVQVTKHTSATFKMETPMDLNDPNHKVQSYVLAETDANEKEFYNPIYDNGMAGFGFPSHMPETVTINSRMLSDNFCAEESAKLKDTLSRIPSEMNERMYSAYMKMKQEYAKMKHLYSINGVVPQNLPGVRQPQQAAQVAQNAGSLANGKTSGLLETPLIPHNVNIEIDVSHLQDGEKTNTESSIEEHQQHDMSLYHTTELLPTSSILPGK